MIFQLFRRSLSNSAISPERAEPRRRLARHLSALTLAGAVFCSLPHTVIAAPCGNTSAGFDSWKRDFAAEAKRAGVRQAGLNALANTTYARRTIAADRNQKSFRYSLEKFMLLPFVSFAPLLDAIPHPPIWPVTFPLGQLAPVCQ